RMSAEQSDKVAAQMSLTADLMDQINASMPPDLCAPAAAYLAHESCSLNGEVLQAGVGGVARIAGLWGNGFWKAGVAAGVIADNLEKIMSLDDARVADAVAPQL